MGHDKNTVFAKHPNIEPTLFSRYGDNNFLKNLWQKLHKGHYLQISGLFTAKIYLWNEHLKQTTLPQHPNRIQGGPILYHRV